MQRLVHVALGRCNIVLKTARIGLIDAVYDAERSPAVRNRIHNDTYGKQIVDLIQCFILILHLLVDGEEMFYSSVDLGMNACVADMLSDFFDDILYVFLTLRTAGGDFIDQIVICFGLQIFQG